ncbi:MAG: hypothetical protein ACXVGR_16000, partial [Mycobacteriaceae bacterium]
LWLEIHQGSDEATMRLVVDGETFEVREPPDRPGHYDCDWVTGPKPGYGFTCVFASARALDAEPLAVDVRADLERAIADFLRGIDPGTGYMPG